MGDFCPGANLEPWQIDCVMTVVTGVNFMQEAKYHDLVTESVNSKCYIYEVRRYAPDGSVKTFSMACTEEEYDEIKTETESEFVGADTVMLDRLSDGFVKEL